MLIYRQYNVYIKRSLYMNGKTALILFDQEDGLAITKITFNVIIDNFYSDGEVYIKNYSENEGMYEWLLKNRIVNPAHRYYELQYAKCPVCYLTKESNKFIK